MFYLLLLSLVLRLVFLNQSLWLDESIEALALMGKLGPLLQYALGDYQPPLYHLIGYVTTQIFGYSEIALRLPSLISGIFTVYFVVKIGELIGNKKVGYLAGILAATSPLLIYYSQEGRTYAMTTFFVTASFYYFMQLLREKSTKPMMFLYFIFTTCFIWTSYLSWFFLLGMGIFTLFKKRYDLFALQILSATSLLAWAPSLISSLKIGQSTMTHSPEWGKVVGGLNWKSLPLTWVKFNIGRVGFDNKYLYAIIVGVLALVHGFILRQVSYKKYAPVLLWLFIPVILGVTVAAIIPVYSYFRVLFVLPAYLLLLALGAESSGKPYLIKLLILFQLAALGYFWISPRYHREDWRTLSSEIGDGVTLAMPSRAQSAPLIYYGYKGNIVEPSHDEISGGKIYYIKYVEDLFDVKKLGRENLLKSGYTIVEQKVYPGIQLDIYENRN